MWNVDGKDGIEGNEDPLNIPISEVLIDINERDAVLDKHYTSDTLTMNKLRKIPQVFLIPTDSCVFSNLKTWGDQMVILPKYAFFLPCVQNFKTVHHRETNLVPK